jgi:hypothetical protein
VKGAVAILALVADPIVAFGYCGKGHPDVARELRDSPLVIVRAGSAPSISEIRRATSSSLAIVLRPSTEASSGDQ